MTIPKTFDIEPLKQQVRGTFSPWSPGVWVWGDPQTRLLCLLARVSPEESLGLDVGMLSGLHVEFVQDQMIAKNVCLRVRFEDIKPRLDGVISQHFVEIKNTGSADHEVIARAKVSRFHTFKK